MLLLATLGLGCSTGAGTPADAPPEESDVTRVVHPRLAHLPDIGGLIMGGCANRLSGCTLWSTEGKNPVVEARRIYDGFFLPRRPADEAAWQWHDATPEERKTIETRPPILPLPIGASPPLKDEYKAWMSLRPDPWETLERRKALQKPSYTARTELPFRRNGDPTAPVKNLDVLARLAADADLPAGDRGRARYYQEQNPFDWQGTAMTHYDPPRGGAGWPDIMATNFIWRILLAPYQMEQALADCTADPEIPCVDTVAALSDVDLYKVYDVRFVRVVPGDAGFQISRVVRVVTVDSGHAVDRQSTYGPGATDRVTGATTPQGNSTPFLLTNQGTGPRLLWRLELGGQLAEAMGAGPGSLAGLVRFAAVNGKTPADLPAEGSCTDVNEGEWKCVDAATSDAGAASDAGTPALPARQKTVKCMGLAWVTYTSGCHIPGRP